MNGCCGCCHLASYVHRISTYMQKNRARRRPTLALALILLLIAPPPPAHAYSVLSHEQVVDLAWKSHIVPLLRRRWPEITPDQIKEAHAYAYGGAIIQDIGYYPFGNKLLSDMLHYVRTGDFVDNLIREAQTPDEFAFALGALAHYTSDSYGHPAVNRATAAEYPRLRRRYGPVVLYDQDPEAHLQTEFGFDVLEVVQQRYAPEAFHDFIGFQVSKPVFERAFQDTYGFPLSLVLTKEDLAIGTYRKTVSTLLPKMTQVAVANYGKQMQQAEPTFVPKKLVYRMSKADYQKRFGNSYQRPGVGARILAFFLKLVPKVGPLRDLSLRVPSADAQKTFLSGMDTVVDHYQQSIHQLSTEPADHPSLQLPPVNLDDGEPIAPGSYPLGDQTYARYLSLLVKPRVPSPPVSANAQPAQASDDQPSGKPGLQPVDPAIRADMEHFFANSQHRAGVLHLKKDQWKHLPEQLETLKQLPATPTAPAKGGGASPVAGN
jgi:Zinc dependent phospholipase C